MSAGCCPVGWCAVSGAHVAHVSQYRDPEGQAVLLVQSDDAPGPSVYVGAARYPVAAAKALASLLAALHHPELAAAITGVVRLAEAELAVTA